MKNSNPIVFTGEDLQSTVVFAAGQLQGGREKQEDRVGYFRDECFCLADGVGGMPHGDTAAELAVETALWGYQHIRLRPTYWLDKRNFMRRIFRTTNIRVWQKRKEPGFGEGLATTLVVLMIGPKNVWVGTIGDSSAFLFREGLIAEPTRKDSDESGLLTSAIGIRRFGLVPHFAGEPFLARDIAVLCTDGVAAFIGEEELRTILADCGTTKQSVTDAVIRILDAARHNGSTDNMSAILVKRISPPSASGSHPPYLV
jgi:protein phosphatase